MSDFVLITLDKIVLAATSDKVGVAFPVTAGSFLERKLMEPTFEAPLLIPRTSQAALESLARWKKLPLQRVEEESKWKHKMLLDILSAAKAIEENDAFTIGCSFFKSTVLQVFPPTKPPKTMDELLSQADALRTTFGVHYDFPSAWKVEKQWQATFLNASDMFVSNLHGGGEGCQDVEQAVVEEREKDPLFMAQLQPPVWVDNNAHTNCPECNGWLLYQGKSHCRCCGRLLCKACVSFEVDKELAKVVPPSDFVDNDGAKKRKACKRCFDLSQNIDLDVVGLLLNVFVWSGMSIEHIARMQTVCKDWARACLYLMLDYRKSFHGPFMTPISPQTRQIALSTGERYTGHSEGVLLLVRAVRWKEPDEARLALRVLRATIEGVQPSDVLHWSLLCTRACSREFNEYHAVNALLWLYAVHDANVDGAKELCFNVLEHRSSVIGAMALLPTLLDIIQYGSHHSDADHAFGGDRTHTPPPSPERLKKCLLTLVSCSRFDVVDRRRLTMQLYRDVCARMEAVPRDSPEAMFLDETKSKLENGNEELQRVSRLIKAIKSSKRDSVEYARESMAQRLDLFHLVSGAPSTTGILRLHPLPYLFDPSVTIDGILMDDVKIMNSSARPMLIPLLSASGTPMQNVHAILFKPEDVRKDYVVCNAVAVLNDLMFVGQHMPHPIPMYRVLPIASDCGIVEIYSDAKCITEIVSEHRSLLDYLQTRVRVGKEPQQSVATLFRYSGEFYTLLSFVFGIGDRHADNVMVTSKGGVLHIDFGFILGEKPVAEKMTTGNSSIRYDSDFVRVANEFCKKKTEDIIQETARMYIRLRAHRDVVLLLLRHLSTQGLKSEAEVFEYISDKLMLGRQDAEAQDYFRKAMGSAVVGGRGMHDTLHETSKLLKLFVSGAALRGWGVTGALGGALQFKPTTQPSPPPGRR